MPVEAVPVEPDDLLPDDVELPDDGVVFFEDDDEPVLDAVPDEDVELPDAVVLPEGALVADGAADGAAEADGEIEADGAAVLEAAAVFAGPDVCISSSLLNI